MKLLRLKVVFEADSMLTTVIILNYLFPMKNCVVKAPENYEKSYEFAPEVLWISTRILWHFASKDDMVKKSYLRFRFFQLKGVSSSWKWIKRKKNHFFLSALTSPSRFVQIE